MNTLPTTTVELVTLEEGTSAAGQHNSSRAGYLTGPVESEFNTTAGQDYSNGTSNDDVFLQLGDGDLNPGNTLLEIDSPPHPYYAPFCSYPIRILSREARRFLSDHLNGDTLVTIDHRKVNWEGLAELTGRDTTYVYNTETAADPCGELLRDWEQEEGRVSSIGKLLLYLQKLGRVHDIIQDVFFMDMIADSVREYGQECEELARASETPRQAPIVSPGERFDAFVCYDEADTDFVMELIYELEYIEGLKLCINARDLLFGDEAYVTAEMIKSRCKRTIVVLSRNLLKNRTPMCDFALKIAQSLSPAASESKLIPIRIDNCEVPINLMHIDCVDFEACYIRAWLWGRLAGTLRLPEEHLLVVEKQRLRKVILHCSRPGGGSGRGTDVRASMRQTLYIPPLPAKRQATSSSRRGGSASSGSTCSGGTSPTSPSRLPPGISRSRGPSFRDRFWSFLSNGSGSVSGR